MLDAVVVDWEDQYESYLGHIHKNIQNGTATDDEIRQLKNLENIVTLYDLMMQNLIEKCGSLSLSAASPEISKEKSLEILIERITHSSNMNPNKLKVTLQQVVKDGYLKLNQKDGKLRWEWDSFLPTQKILQNKGKVPKMTKVI